MFYEQLSKACKMKKTSVTAVLKQIGIGAANGTYWKNGSIPSSDVVVKLAEFLNVSTDFLLLGKELEQNINNNVHTGDMTNSKIIAGQDNSINYSSDAEPISDAVLVCDDAIEIDKIIKSLNPRARAKFLSKVYDLAEEFKE